MPRITEKRIGIYGGVCTYNDIVVKQILKGDIRNLSMTGEGSRRTARQIAKSIRPHVIHCEQAEHIRYGSIVKWLALRTSCREQVELVKYVLYTRSDANFERECKGIQIARFDNSLLDESCVQIDQRNTFVCSLLGWIWAVGKVGKSTLLKQTAFAADGKWILCKVLNSTNGVLLDIHITTTVKDVSNPEVWSSNLKRVENVLRMANNQTYATRLLGSPCTEQEENQIDALQSIYASGQFDWMRGNNEEDPKKIKWEMSTVDIDRYTRIG